MNNIYLAIGLFIVIICFVAIAIFPISYSDAPCFWGFVADTNQQVLNSKDAARILSDFNNYIESEHGMKDVVIQNFPKGDSKKLQDDRLIQGYLMRLNAINGDDIKYLPFGSIKHQSSFPTGMPSNDEYVYIYADFISVTSDGKICVKYSCP